MDSLLHHFVPTPVRSLHVCCRCSTDCTWSAQHNLFSAHNQIPANVKARQLLSCPLTSNTRLDRHTCYLALNRRLLCIAAASAQAKRTFEAHLLRVGSAAASQ